MYKYLVQVYRVVRTEARMHTTLFFVYNRWKNQTFPSADMPPLHMSSQKVLRAKHFKAQIYTPVSQISRTPTRTSVCILELKFCQRLKTEEQ